MTDQNSESFPDGDIVSDSELDALLQQASTLAGTLSGDLGVDDASPSTGAVPPDLANTEEINPGSTDSTENEFEDAPGISFEPNVPEEETPVAEQGESYVDEDDEHSVGDADGSEKDEAADHFDDDTVAENDTPPESAQIVEAGSDADESALLADTASAFDGPGVDDPAGVEGMSAERDDVAFEQADAEAPTADDPPEVGLEPDASAEPSTPPIDAAAAFDNPEPGGMSFLPDDGIVETQEIIEEKVDEITSATDSVADELGSEPADAVTTEAPASAAIEIPEFMKELTVAEESEVESTPAKDAPVASPAADESEAAPVDEPEFPEPAPPPSAPTPAPAAPAAAFGDTGFHDTDDDEFEGAASRAGPIGRMAHKLLPATTVVVGMVATLLELVDRPFSFVGDSLRMLLGWIAIATVATSLMILIVDLF